MEKEKEPLTSPWIYAGLDYSKRVLVLSKHTKDNSTLHGMIKCCAQVFEVSIEDMMGPCRKQEFSLARHAFNKIARERSSQSFVEIGKFLGGRDHATIVHSSNKARDLIESWSWFKDKYNLCETLLSGKKLAQEEEMLESISKRIQFVKPITLDANEHNGTPETDESVIQNKR
jgi:hypothetical protein